MRSAPSAGSKPAIPAAPFCLVSPRFCIGHYTRCPAKLSQASPFRQLQQFPLHLEQVSPLPLRRLWLVHPLSTPISGMTTSEPKLARVAPSAPFAAFATTPFSSLSSNQLCLSHRRKRIRSPGAAHVFIRSACTHHLKRRVAASPTPAWRPTKVLYAE